MTVTIDNVISPVKTADSNSSGQFSLSVCGEAEISKLVKEHAVFASWPKMIKRPEAGPLRVNLIKILCLN